MKLTRKHNQDTEYIALTSQNKKYKIKNPFSEEIKINGRKVDIKLLDDELGFTYILYKRKKFLVEIVEKNQNRYTVIVNGVSYSLSIETPISYKRKRYLEKTKSKSKTEFVYAPMPGKILDVLIEEGVNVKSGEALLILEAMKMQNEIIAPVNGKVIKVMVRKDDIVNKEDIMFEIEK
jgi:biotin carboxyl carrier protein